MIKGWNCSGRFSFNHKKPFWNSNIFKDQLWLRNRFGITFLRHFSIRWIHPYNAHLAKMAHHRVSHINICPHAACFCHFISIFSTLPLAQTHKRLYFLLPTYWMWQREKRDLLPFSYDSFRYTFRYSQHLPWLKVIT